MPTLGMSMEKATLARWIVPNGATVEAGQPLFEMTTEKIECEVEAEAGGIIYQVADADSTVAPGAVVGYLLESNEAPAPGLRPISQPPAEAAQPLTPETSRSRNGEWSKASWAARAKARLEGIDLSTVAGSGPGGRIIESDVALALVMRPSLEEVRRPRPSVSEALRARQRGEPVAVDTVQATPLARRLAGQLGVSLSSIAGSGPFGRIQLADVEQTQQGTAVAEAAREGPAGEDTIEPLDWPLTEAGRRARRSAASAAALERTESVSAAEDNIPYRGMRRTIGERMRGSLQEMAQLTITCEADISEAERLREQLLEEWSPLGIQPGFTDLVVRAAARALAEHPRLNSSLDGDVISLHESISVGVAVALDDGLIVPVLHDADRMSLKTISGEVADLAARARDGRLALDDVQGGTFTVTSLGMFGVDAFTPIVNPPQCAILGIGQVHDQPRFVAGELVRRSLMTLSLSFDHRIVDGAPAARFLGRVRSILERPYLLLTDD